MVFLSTILARLYAWNISHQHASIIASGGTASASAAASTFFSTTAAAIANRSVAAAFSFGWYRHVRMRMVLEEVVMGCFLILPCAILVGHLTIRLAIRGGGSAVLQNYLYMRPDVWTTLVIAIVGDLLLELLIPSLQCLPLLQEEGVLALQTIYVSSSGDRVVGTGATQARMQQRLQEFIPSRMANEMSYGQWFQQTWGFGCPPHGSGAQFEDTFNSEFYFLKQQGVAVLLGIRLAFLCLGVYVGESFVPVALTGGIACGKSTVAQLLLQRQDYNQSNNNSSSNANNTSTTNNINNSNNRLNTMDEVDREGTFCIIDADSIAHEILLPPHVLAKPPPPPGIPEFKNKTHWTVQPHESVYHAVLNAFAAENNNKNSNDTDQEEEEDDDDDNDTASGTGGGTGIVSKQDHDADEGNTIDKSSHKKRSGSKKDAQQPQHLPPRHFLLDQQGLIDRTKLGTIVFHNTAARRRLGAITHPQIFLVMMKRIIHYIYFLPIYSSWMHYPASSLLLLGQYFWPFSSYFSTTTKKRTRKNRDNDDDDDDDEALSTSSAMTTSTDIVCVDVPLLFESGQLCWLFALVICVATENDDLILQRLQKRNPEWTREHCRARIASQLPLAEKMRRSDFVILNNTNSLDDLQDSVERVRIQVVQRIYGILGLTLMQMLLLVSLSLISILIFSPTPRS